MVGGDWQLSDERPYNDLDPNSTSQNLFTRVSYDVSDSISVFAQYGWSQNHLWNLIQPPFFLGNLTIQRDNAYLPESVRTAMFANNITSFAFGTESRDLPQFGNDNTRQTYRANVGVEGSLNAFDSSWNWNAYYAYGATKLSVHNPYGVSNTRYRLAIDAVVNPTTGQIVCRSTLTSPNNGCKPWNPMGVGVNTGNSASVEWMNYNGVDFQHGVVKQQTYAASFSGEPLSLWAGPVSLAVSLEHRMDSVHAVADAVSLAMDHGTGNYAGLDGEQSVTEGALETVIPLARGESWAQNWDLSAAVRFTGYELSGFITTYKFGTTYAPIDDIKFRITRSRDVRSPNLQELFSPPQASGGGGTVINDRFTGTSYAIGASINIGNPNLVPEKADTTGIGIVFAPRFIDGFNASVDYWDVNIGGAILPLTVQQVMDTCYNGRFPALCSNITRVNGLVTAITNFSVNLATQDVRGIDLEASYRFPMSDIASDWRGDFSLHGNMTFYLRNYQDNTFNAPSDHVGENNASNPPNWKLTATAQYALDPVSVALTARAVSGGTINSEYIECTSGCPTSTTDHQTINYNRIAGRFYLDANVSYKLNIGESTTGDLFFSVKNMLNNDPPPAVAPFYTAISNSAASYDMLGAVYRAGIRFKM